MNKQTLIICFLTIFSYTLCIGQAYRDEFTFTDEDWFAQADSASDEDAIILYRDRTSEYEYDNNGNLLEYFFFRSVIYLRTDKAVDNYNKIYINISNAIELEEYDARVLYRNGSSKELGEEVLKEGTTEEGATYNYFAIEGAEEGSIVDYYYVVKKYPNVDGSFSTIQYDVPINNYRHRIVSPWNLAFEMKAINGELAIEEDSTDTVRNVLVARAENLQGLKDEPFSNPAAYRLGMAYKLTDNYYSRNFNMFTYGTISQNLYEALNMELDKKQEKALKKFVKEISIDDDADEEKKIRQIENYMKSNVVIVEASNSELGNIDYILDNRIASEFGMVRLLYRVFRSFDVKMELVTTCNRYEKEFPEDIENYTFLEDYLFYFPAIDKYTMPDAQIYRLGIVPTGFINNNGLFIREVSVGDMKTGAGKIKFIDVYPKDHSAHDMWIKAEITEDMSTARIEMREEMTGYNALNFQPYYDYVSGEDEEELMEASVKSVCENADIESVECENKGGEFLMQKPFIVNSVYTNEEFMEMAGDKILFKIGELIGPQAEMYQEEERTMKVENSYNHSYYREIEFTVPDGYKCVNLDDLNMNIDPFEEHHTVFTSTYETEGNKIIVKVNEYYDELILPIEDFEKFRDVINAAANFNKITLVLEKE